jgi:hypothetical protein
MPQSGARPKPEGEAVTRNPRQLPWTDVPNVPNRSGPRLPWRSADGTRWHRQVVARWAGWKAMPQAALWGGADWGFALDSAEVAQRFYMGQTGAATELRARERVMGTTLDARLGLRIRYVDPPAAALAVVVAADDYRDL